MSDRHQHAPCRTRRAAWRLPLVLIAYCVVSGLAATVLGGVLSLAFGPRLRLLAWGGAAATIALTAGMCWERAAPMADRQATLARSLARSLTRPGR
jgi:hypothetical protein